MLEVDSAKLMGGTHTCTELTVDIFSTSHTGDVYHCSKSYATNEELKGTSQHVHGVLNYKNNCRLILVLIVIGYSRLCIASYSS